MKRAVILGTGAFPLIIRLWLENLKKWQDEVDVIYIAVDHWNVPSTRDYILNLIKQFPKVKILENLRGWPDSYADAIKQSKEDSFLIMHDDTLVYKKGVVDKYFKIAEEGKVVTPLHGIYEPRVIVDEALQKKYDWTNDTAPYSFLLYFLFISRLNLEKTSINFNGVGWKVGDDIPLLGIKNAPVSIAGDTGFLLGLELFDKNVPFYTIPRSETASLVAKKDLVYFLIREMKDKHGIFSNGWLHLQNTGNTIPLWFKEDLDARRWYQDIEKVRLAWMYTMLQVEDYKEIPEFKKLADNIFNGVMIRCGLDLKEIETISNIFQILIYE